MSAQPPNNPYSLKCHRGAMMMSIRCAFVTDILQNIPTVQNIFTVYIVYLNVHSEPVELQNGKLEQ